MAQPLSSDVDVLNTLDEHFHDANIAKLGYRVRVKNTSLERAVVAKNISNSPREVVVCQCDGTAKEVDACLMGMKIREGRMGKVYGGAFEDVTLILPSVDELEGNKLALPSVRAQCNRQAHDTLLDYQGA